MFTIALCLPGAAAGPRRIRALAGYFSQRGNPLPSTRRLRRICRADARL